MTKKGILKSLEKKENDETNSEPLRTITRFYVRIPLCSVHINHPVGESATIGQYVDKRVVDKIYELVKRNITNVAEVKRCLDRYVETDVFGGVPDLRSRRRRIGGIIPCAKTCEIILLGQFLHRSTLMMTKNLSAKRFLIGKRDHLKPSSFIEQETIHLMQLIQRRKIPLGRTPSSSYIKSHGNRDC